MGGETLYWGDVFARFGMWATWSGRDTAGDAL